MISPNYILSFVKADAGVEHDEEKTGYGWKTDTLIAAKDTVSNVKCQMDRPPM